MILQTNPKQFLHNGNFHIFYKQYGNKQTVKLYQLCSHFEKKNSNARITSKQYLPNKQDVDVNGNDAPSDPFLLMTTIFAYSMLLHPGIEKFSLCHQICQLNGCHLNN